MFTRTPSKLLNGASQSDGRGGDLGLQAKVETKGKQVWSDSELREEKRPGLAGAGTQRTVCSGGQRWAGAGLIGVCVS